MTARATPGKGLKCECARRRAQIGELLNCDNRNRTSCSEEGDRWSAGGRMVVGKSVTREARRTRVNRLRDIYLARIFHDRSFRELKMIEAGSGLSASQRARRRQFFFRDEGAPVRAGDVAFDKMFARGAATMPLGHAAFHRTDIRLARHQ